MIGMKLLGNTKVSISDSLFNSKNVKYIQIYHVTDAAFTHKPETKGTIAFVYNDVEGAKKFKGSNIMEVISQMAEFIDTLK